MRTSQATRRTERRVQDVLPHPIRRASDVPEEAPRKKRARRSATPPSETHVTVEQVPVPRTPSKSARARRAQKAKPAAPQRLFLRGTNLQPTGDKLVPCLAGSKQSILVDQLRRKEGATMAELIEALAGGRRSWTEATVRSGFGWDLKLKGYGVHSTFDGEGVEHFHLVIPKGQRVPKHSQTRVSNKK